MQALRQIQEVLEKYESVAQVARRMRDMGYTDISKVDMAKALENLDRHTAGGGES